MMLPWVGLASKPFFIRLKHIFQAVLLSEESLTSIAFSKPFPRIDETILDFDKDKVNSSLNKLPSL